jgi:hypothetical protein
MRRAGFPEVQIRNPDGGSIRDIVERRYPDSFYADLVRTIHGFDALLVMSGSTSSANL